MKSFAARATAEKADAPTAPKGVAMVDNRAVAVAQRQAQAAIDNSPPQVAQRKNTTGLPDKLKAGVESLSGHSLDDVKVHYNSAKPAQLQALAYAQGTDIHVAPGQEKHLPHEAWHVAQQKQGRVRPTLQAKGNVNINNDAGLEKEADVMGKKSLAIVQRQSEGYLASKSLSFEVIQLQEEEGDAKKLTWSEWFWKHRWKFFVAAMTIVAIYALYKKYGGGSILSSPPTSEPPAPSSSADVPTPVSAPTSASTANHAWPPGKPYTALDKVKGLASALPGGGLVIKSLEQIVSGKPDGPALVAEIVKLHPYAWPANVYDSVSEVLSYYSSGKYELGQTKQIIEKVFEEAQKAKASLTE